MTTYTVQCGYAAYYANTVQVEAENLEAALEVAIEKANDDPQWKALDHCDPRCRHDLRAGAGRTFVDAVAEGADADPWSGFVSVLLVPDRFTEQGEPPTVTVIMEGGLVQDVIAAGGPVRVLVKDYDTEGLDPEVYDIRRDENGDAYTLTERTP
jgi:hypothetical protein